MTFIDSVKKLLVAEGYNLIDYQKDAKEMDGNLIYVVSFCKENEIHLNHDNVKGILIGLWSLVGEDGFNNGTAVDSLIEDILNACK